MGRGYPRKKFYTEIILHLVLIIITFFYMRTLVGSISYYTSIYVIAATIKHVHRRACCVRGYHVYREIGKQLFVKYSRYADPMERMVISLAPLESFRENGRDAAATPWFDN